MTRTSRTLSTFAAVGALALTALVVPAQTAQAAPSPLQRCRSGAGADVVRHFRQGGGTAGVGFPGGPDPANAVFPGDVVKVTVNDRYEVNVQGWAYEPYDVDGKSEPAGNGYPFPGWNKYANFFRWNNNPGGWVGNHDPHSLRELARCKRAPSIPARWGTQINDDNIGDNSGEWRFTFRLWCANRHRCDDL
ncbi:hypothetical protein JCM4814A_50760 [Streptomyces phaeofaciens JCM 4814]|uniref:Secreted protein n=1 Tax=Streptomyces phaeofaciens TaxID=68254 RepID=A0A918HNV0_9ACTN|nr:hypothetical protein [Streptomyces phaeofaciens]GGT87893.1 hypothetical protein GCM10010226_77900 [Streptomyces phaeofaciens]